MNYRSVNCAHFSNKTQKLKLLRQILKLFCANRNVLINSEVKFDVLSIVFKEYFDLDEILDLSRGLLNELYERGVFKELHIYSNYSHFDQEAIDELVSYKGLTKLYTGELGDLIDPTLLIDLKSLCVNKWNCIKNMQSVAETLTNLEFVEITFARFKDIVPLIRYSSKINTIVLFRLLQNEDDDGDDEDQGEKEEEENFGIEELNAERSKLINASKLTIYVEEHVYLWLKWINNETKWSFIEIKRGASYDALNHCFDHLEHLNVKF